MGKRKHMIDDQNDATNSEKMFTKRCQTLFNKAAVLHTKCNADVAIFAVSNPTTNQPKLYSVGYPSAPAVLQAFLQDSQPLPVAENATTTASKKSSLVEECEEQLKKVGLRIEECGSVEELVAYFNRLEVIKVRLQDRMKCLQQQNGGDIDDLFRMEKRQWEDINDLFRMETCQWEDLFPSVPSDVAAFLLGSDYDESKDVIDIGELWSDL